MTCLNLTYLNITKWCVFIKASTRWCRGQVGGGWEETDSGNSSSHNSSQEMVANSRASEGSKSAGAESQSEASKESSGDLSERCVHVLAKDKAHFIFSCTPFFTDLFLICSVFFQGGGVAVGGLRPGVGADQQADWGIQNFSVQRGEPVLYQRVSAAKVMLKK